MDEQDQLVRDLAGELKYIYNLFDLLLAQSKQFAEKDDLTPYMQGYCQGKIDLLTILSGRKESDS